MNNSKSTFVTVVAWIFIVLSGLSIQEYLAKNVQAYLTYQNSDISPLMENAEVTQNMSAISLFFVENMQYLYVCLLLGAIILLLSSIGLLKRKNWARITFVSLLGIWIVGNIAGIFFLGTLVPDLSQENSLKDVESILVIVQIYSAVIGIASSILLAWVVKKLMTYPIKNEFRA